MDSLEMIKIVRKLLFCQYPFRWLPRQELENIPDGMIQRLTEHLEEKVFDDDFQLEKLMLYVGLAYEYTFEERVDEALKVLKTGEDMLNEQTNKFLEENSCEAISHVILSTKVHLLVWKGDLEKALSVLSSIPEIDEMNKVNQAAIHGLRAMFFGEYGITGSKLALKFSSQAILMNQEESLWHFLKGKFIGRIRRVEQPFEVPQCEEMLLLNTSLEKNPNNASFAVFTAQLYRETANRMFRTHLTNNSLYPSTKITIDELNRKSVELYNKSIRIKPDCAHLLFRCAKGFIILPPPFRDGKRAKELLNKGLEKIPDSGFGNHVMAQYYERIAKEPHKAMKHLRICEKKEIFGAVMDLLRLEYKMGGMNVVSRLTNLVPVFKEASRQCQIYSQLVSYHIFAMNDLKKACEYASEVIRLKSDTINMTQHRSIVLSTFDPVNIYDLLIDEIKIQLQNSNCENKLFFHEFLKTLAWEGIPVSQTKPKYLKKDIVNNQSRSAKSANQKFRNNAAPSHDRFHRKRSPVHQTDVDKNMSEIFEKCRKELECKTKNNSNRALETKDFYPCNADGTKLNALEEGENIVRKQPVEKNSENEDNEYKVFQMKIYEKTLKALKEPAPPQSANSNRNVVRNEHAEKNDESDNDYKAFRMNIYKKTREVCEEQALSRTAVSIPNEERDQSVGKNYESGDNDHVTMRMKTLESREKLEVVDSNRPRDSVLKGTTDIAVSLRDMKISDDVREKDRTGREKYKDRIHSYQTRLHRPDDEGKVSSTCGESSENKSKHSRRSGRVTESETDNDDLKRKSDFSSRSKNHLKERRSVHDSDVRSDCSRQKDTRSDPYQDHRFKSSPGKELSRKLKNDSDELEQRSDFSTRSKTRSRRHHDSKSKRSSDKDEFELKYNRSKDDYYYRERKSKHPRRRGQSSESSNVSDDLNSRSSSSKQRKDRSQERKGLERRHSYRKKHAGSRDNSDVELQSNCSRRSGNRKVVQRDYKSKHSPRRGRCDYESRYSPARSSSDDRSSRRRKHEYRRSHYHDDRSRKYSYIEEEYSKCQSTRGTAYSEEGMDQRNRSKNKPHDHSDDGEENQMSAVLEKLSKKFEPKTLRF